MKSIAYLAVLLTSQAAFAETTCNFTSECMSGESCAETTFSLSYETAECVNERLPISATTDFGDLTGLSLAACADASAFALTGSGASYLLTLHEGAAQLTTHMDGPMAITYTGTCEAQQ